jgi:hypothetical protein
MAGPNHVITAFKKHQLYQALRGRLSTEAKANTGEEFFTVHNWANWAYIWLKVRCGSFFLNTCRYIGSTRHTGLLESMDEFINQSTNQSIDQALDKPHGPPTKEELTTATTAAGAAAAAKQRQVGGKIGEEEDDEASVASTVSAVSGGSESGSDYEGDSSEGSSGSEAEYCLNVDGTRRACSPQLHRRRQSPRDVLVSADTVVWA